MTVIQIRAPVKRFGPVTAVDDLSFDVRLVRSQIAGVIGVFVWTVIIESLFGGLFTAVRPYLPYTAATALAGTPLGSASFGPGRGSAGAAALPFAAATALLVAIALVGALLATRTTLRRDIT